ncbi:MAG: MBL fold metallo-hydrolase [Deltaproteobacteria bacterium]|nr:MBL fold metallo-hydrolase [Deltaproteobacteria bacterium]
MQITGEVFQVGGDGLTAAGDAAIYLVRFGDRAALVDAGCGYRQDRLFNHIEECGVRPEQIEYLLVTHCHFDHTGGIPGVKERTGCRVVAHDLDAGFLEEGDDLVTAAKWYGASLDPVQVDVRLYGARNEIDLGGRKIQAVHVPGHSPGSLVYLTESEGWKVLFAQDVHGPINEMLLSNREDYRRSLEVMISLEADILCEGHYGVFRGREECAAFIRSFL